MSKYINSQRDFVTINILWKVHITISKSQQDISGLNMGELFLVDGVTIKTRNTTFLWSAIKLECWVRLQFVVYLRLLLLNNQGHTNFPQISCQSLFCVGFSVQDSELTILNNTLLKIKYNHKTGLRYKAAPNSIPRSEIDR